MLKYMSFRWLWGVAVIAFLVSAVVLTTGQASASHTLFIVDDDGKAEVGNCKSQTPTFSTIQEAIDDPGTGDGDYIFVCPGTYVEDVVVDKAGLFLLGISNGEKRPVVDGGSKGVTGDGPTISITADGVTLDNFTIINAGTETPTPGIGVLSDNNTITNNIVSGNRCGINLWDGEGAGAGGANGNFVAHNTFFNNTSDGIRLQDGSSGNTIYHNDTHNNASDGIELRSGAANNDLRDNNAHHNSSDGIFLKGGTTTGNTLVNNDAHHNSKDGIDDDVGNDVSEAANNVHHNGATECDGCVA